MASSASDGAFPGGYTFCSVPPPPPMPPPQQHSDSLLLLFSSSDQSPSGSDSIFNAERVLLSRNLSSLSQSPEGVTFGPGPHKEEEEELPRLPVGIDASLDRRLLHVQSHDHGSTVPAEQTDQLRLKNVSSMPMLTQRTGRGLCTLNLHTVITSDVRPQPAFLHSQSDNFEPQVSHPRSLSLNDLERLSKAKPKTVSSAKSKVRSSSSDDVKNKCLCNAFPFKPVQSPPYRSPTPPGLPSFGTHEAQEYRLMTVSPPSRTSIFLQRCLGRAEHESEDHISVSSNTINPLSSPASPTSPLSPPMSLLKRVLGVSRMVDSPPPAAQNPRSCLPPGIFVANGPGALVQADDGTFVRGRWGSRLSGHGVGLNQLNYHPLTHAAGLHSIDETVRAIDKACEAADEENRNRQMTAACSTLEQSMTGVGGLALRPSTMSNAFVSPRLSGDSHLPNREIDVWPSTVTCDYMMATNPSGASDNVLSTAAPQRYMTVSSMSRAVPPDRLNGLRAFVVQGEYESDRHNLIDQDEKPGCCENCSEGFWRFCCSSSVS